MKETEMKPRKTIIDVCCGGRMKAVLMSIKPKYCELIASGKKMVEVRKTKPKFETPFKCYIYETNWHDNTYWKNHHKGRLGKVIGEFVCDKIQEITYTQIYNFGRYKDVCEAETRLDFYELDDYLKQKNGYGWHISDLVIYDKPKELREFLTIKCTNKKSSCSECETKPHCIKPITRPPQSWCYVEELR